MKSQRNGLISSDNTQLSPPKTRRCEAASKVSQLQMPEGSHLQSIAPACPTPILAQYLNAAVSANTRRAYRGDLADFERYGGRVPCTPQALAEYIAFRSTSHTPETISRRIVGICRAHTALGYPDPCKTDLVRTVLRGVRRMHARPQKRASALVRDDLVLVMPKGNRAGALRDRALILLGFTAALRRSELVALDVADLEVVTGGLLVHVRKSKTDQEGAGRLIAVPYGRSTLCAVRAVCDWIEASEATVGPVFVSLQKGGGLRKARLSAGSVSAIVKGAVANAGLNPKNYSGHSLRAGLVTSAAQAGVSMHKIMEQTGHRSVQMVTRYIRDACLFENNAAGAVL